MNSLLILVLVILIGVILAETWKLLIFPMLVDVTTKEIEKNPKWITPKLRQTYYGFSNIDIITAKSS